MNEYAASNGYTLKASIGSILVHNRGEEVAHALGKFSIEALREFFQHERDEERGLWRSPSDPTWTAVRRNTTIYFQNEDHERSFHFVPKLEASIQAWSSDLQALAYEYIKAHPERKPWQDATAEDVWVITWGNQIMESAARLSREGLFLIIGGGIVRPEDIRTGRRIWPEPD